MSEDVTIKFTPEYARDRDLADMLTEARSFVR